MKSRMLERIKAVGVPLCASLWMACGGLVPAAGDEALGSSRTVEKGGKNAKGGRDEKSPASKSKSPEADPEKLVQETGQGLGAFGKLLPLGQKNRDVKIPSFRDGNPSSFIQAATMTRVDGDKMEMDRLDIRMFGQTEDKDLRISMPTATYHMTTEVLSSDRRSRISRSDFDLQGDTLIFDTRTRQGKMTGHIHMVIQNPDSFRQKPDKPAPSGREAAVPPGNPEKPTPPIEK